MRVLVFVALLLPSNHAPHLPHAAHRNLLNISQLAFRTCVHTFLHTQLTEKEEKCISVTSKKFIASSLRATSRLAEAQAIEVKRERSAANARLSELRAAGGGLAAPLS